MRFPATHDIAGPTGVCSFFLASNSSFFNLVRKISLIFSSSGVQLEFVVSQHPIAACIDDHTSGQIVPGVDVTCVLVNVPLLHE